MEKMAELFILLILNFCGKFVAGVNTNFGNEDSTLREHDIKQNIMGHLKLDQIPTFTKHEYENFVVPSHVRNQYDYLLMKHQRKRRDASEFSLGNLYHSVQQNPGIPGNIVYTDPFRESLQFDMQDRIPTGSVVTMAELRLFKKLPNLSGQLPKPSLSSKGNRHPHDFLRRHPGRMMKPIRHARVSIYHTLTNIDGTTKNHLIDSKLILVNGSGWQAFDVTDAIHQWQQHPTRFMSIKLEMWVEGTRPGQYAATISRLVRFSNQENSHISEKPELIVFTEKEEIGRGRTCKENSKPAKQKCCRGNHYIDFQLLEWTQFWIVEPKGYDAYSCSGRCSNQKRKKFPRSCAVAESDPLPVMFLVEDGGETKVQVSEFPNMIVRRCSCALDKFFTV